MKIRPFEEYSQAYPNIAMHRDGGGVLELRLHSGDGPMIWAEGPHAQLTNLYTEIATDDDNKIVILTGTGDYFISGMKASAADTGFGLREAEGGDGKL
jgi:enoyl-CoA hydratase/carnithine racemase